jgi:hypothetical protein
MAASMNVGLMTVVVVHVLAAERDAAIPAQVMAGKTLQREGWAREADCSALP